MEFFYSPTISTMPLSHALHLTLIADSPLSIMEQQDDVEVPSAKTAAGQNPSSKTSAGSI